MIAHTLLNTLATPTAITALATNSTLLAAGCADGSVRLYALPETKVHKAIRGLPDEVASLTFEIGVGKENYIWTASGRRIYQFDIRMDKIIMDVSMSLKVLEVCKGEEDAINKIDVNNTHLAFTTDDGIVGVIDLTNYSISRMFKRHDRIAYTLSFIPGYPRELISGGFDDKLIHHHYLYKSMLSQYDIGAIEIPEPEEGNIVLARPFIYCVSVSQKGILVASTADGKLIIGLGGSKYSKRSKKWEGLKADDLFVVNAADGPIVAVRWITESELFLVTLHGIMKTYDFETKALISVESASSAGSPIDAIFKVNDCTVHNKSIIVAGLDMSGRGIALITSYTNCTE